MKALSIRQPWAWAILHAGKRVENRAWRFPALWRGTFLLHAAKGCTLDEWEDAAVSIARANPLGPEVPPLGLLARGAIVGRARLVQIVDNGMAPRDPWAVPGVLGLCLDDVAEISWPLQYKGALGFFDVSDELLAGRSWVPCP